MCVIMVVRSIRPTPEMVDAAWETNSQGGGVAWRENGEVHWKKGLSQQEMQDMCADLPLPYIAHFRIATNGGVTDRLCHPFEISPEARLDTEGHTAGRVLFHNGHWTDWKRTVMDFSSKRGDLPPGKWSDTRGIAYMAGICGLGVLDLIDEKVAVLGPNMLEVWGNWTLHESMYVSNTHWTHRVKKFSYGHPIQVNGYHTSPPHSLLPAITPPAVPPAVTTENPPASPGGGGQGRPFLQSGKQPWKLMGISKNQWKRRRKEQEKQTEIEQRRLILARVEEASRQMDLMVPTLH